MQVWKRLLNWLGGQSSAQRVFTLDADLQRSLRALADQERLEPEEVAANLIQQAIQQRQTLESAWERWQGLTAREQDTVALICLGYTTRQAAARLVLSPETVRTYARRALVKFNVHSREELRRLLVDWDFSAWQ